MKDFRRNILPLCYKSGESLIDMPYTDERTDGLTAGALGVFVVFCKEV